MEWIIKALIAYVCGIVSEDIVRLALVRRASRRFVSSLREQVVRHAHFHVVRFPGKNHDRFVLRLPAKARNCPVVAATIRHALDTQLLANLLRGLVTTQNLYVLNSVQNSQSIQLQRNAETHIAAAIFRLEISWRQIIGRASARLVGRKNIAAPDDREQLVHPSIRCAIGLSRETHFTDWPVLLNE